MAGCGQPLDKWYQLYQNEGMTNRTFQLHDKVRRYDFTDVGEIRQVLNPDRVVVYWPNDPRGRSTFSLEWTEYLAPVDDGEES